jgi:hypothetical protein
MGMCYGMSREGTPGTLLLAAGVEAAEAAGLAVAGVLTAVDTAAGHSSQSSSGIGLTLLAFIVVAGLALIAAGLARVRPWSRTPAVLTQVLTGVIAVYLLQAHRFDWGVPALLLALAGLAALLAPPSWRALNRPAPAEETTTSSSKPKLNSQAGGRPPGGPPVSRRS